jgi:PIN domain nuclease of toxin-antitoxin system
MIGCRRRRTPPSRSKTNPSQSSCAQLVERGRIELGTDLAAWLALVETIPTVVFVPVDNEIGVKSVNLPGNFHRDPADRIIVATARKHGVALVTADERIRSYPHVRTIW